MVSYTIDHKQKDNTWFSFREGEEAPFEIIKKINLVHMNMLEKRGNFKDVRISVNIEQKVKAVFDEKTIINIWHKRRTSYIFRNFHFDLTEVREEDKHGATGTPSFEIEAEMKDVDLLFRETPRYFDWIERFMRNLDGVAEALG